MIETADRLAEEALKQFGREGRFTISFEHERLEDLKAAFERLGCTVEIPLHKKWLDVTCPED